MTAVLNDGLIVMLIGMGVVFSFLIIMVFALQIMTKVVQYLNKIFPEIVPEQKVSGKKRVGKEDEEVAVAIAAVMRNM